MKVYVASSWRNPIHPPFIATLRDCGFEVYDFRAEPGAFAWADIDPMWETWSAAAFAPGTEFVPGRFLAKGVTITSRGCPRRCPFCFVPGREGALTKRASVGWNAKPARFPRLSTCWGFAGRDQQKIRNGSGR